MFVFNVKFNKNNFFKTVLAIMAIICISLSAIGIFKMYNSNSKFENFSEECIQKDGIANLTDENYANVLKEVHENLDTYIGQRISYTGYVYRVPDIEDNQFILARDMRLKDTNQTVVIGFLCTIPNAMDFETYSWIKITGTIEKGNYFGDIPCIHVTEIEKTAQPDNCIVPEPNENYIETAVI